MADYSSTGLAVDRELYTIARDEVLSKVTIPTYMYNHIDNEVDLNIKDSCLCPFHEENTPSFRYNRAENYWRCFGKCKDGGTVIELHKYKFGFDNHFDALADMKKKFGKMYGLTFKDFFYDATNATLTVTEILSEKKTTLSLTDFMKEPVDNINYLIDQIELKLILLKRARPEIYAEACIKFDSLFVDRRLNVENAKKMLDTLKKVV